MNELVVDGRRLRLSTLDRVLWPATGFTKGDMLDYYARVAPALVPHLADRPVTLVRFPGGVDGHGWYQTQCRAHPQWLRTRVVGGRTGTPQRYCVIDDAAGLLWAANLSSIELHPLLSRGERVDEPTAVVFDLDPGPPAGLVECCSVALALREALREAGLDALVKTSGSLGLHVVVPLNAPHGYDETKRFARAVAALLAERRPDEVVDRPARALRTGKVLVDWAQNDRVKSTIAPYSLRALELPTVATPVAWDEVERALAEQRPEQLVFSPADALERVARDGDVHARALSLVQRLAARL